MLTEDGLVDGHAVGHVDEVASREEGRVQRCEAIPVGADHREEERLDERRVIHGRRRQWLDDHALRQLALFGHRSVGMLELRKLRRVEACEVGAAPLLIGPAWHGQPLIGLQSRAPTLAQPVGFAPELFALEGLGRKWHRYPTEPSISSWIKRLSSTAYSSGSSLVNGSMKPLTIIVSASLRVMPRLIR